MEIGGLTNILKFFNFFLFISNIEKKIEKKMKEKTCILRIQVLFTINETSKSHTHTHIYITRRTTQILVTNLTGI